LARKGRAGMVPARNDAAYASPKVGCRSGLDGGLFPMEPTWL